MALLLNFSRSRGWSSCCPFCLIKVIFYCSGGARDMEWRWSSSFGPYLSHQVDGGKLLPKKRQRYCLCVLVRQLRLVKFSWARLWVNLQNVWELVAAGLLSVKLWPIFGCSVSASFFLDDLVFGTLSAGQHGRWAPWAFSMRAWIFEAILVQQWICFFSVIFCGQVLCMK